MVPVMGRAWSTPPPPLGGFLAGVGAQRPTVVLEVMRGGGPEVT